MLCFLYRFQISFHLFTQHTLLHCAFVMRNHFCITCPFCYTHFSRPFFSPIFSATPRLLCSTLSYRDVAWKKCRWSTWPVTLSFFIFIKRDHTRRMSCVFIQKWSLRLMHSLRTPKGGTLGALPVFAKSKSIRRKVCRRRRLLTMLCKEPMLDRISYSSNSGNIIISEPGDSLHNYHETSMKEKIQK